MNRKFEDLLEAEREAALENHPLYRRTLRRGVSLQIQPRQ
jgi:hypothetical protein